jgi:neutral ceramidase
MNLPYRFFRGLLKIFLLLIVLLILFALVSIGFVNRELDTYVELYKETKSQINAIKVNWSSGSEIKVGFSKVSITPSSPTATAGYGNRLGAEYTSIHDSVFVRALVFDNGMSKVAVVSADLLIIPPTVTAAVKEYLVSAEDSELRAFSLDNIYFGATHTHNSVGNWAEGATSFLYGDYRPEVVAFLADRIATAIAKADRNAIPSALYSGSVAMPGNVQNRLIDEGSEDSLLRLVEIKRQDSSRLILTTFAAHATCLSSRDIVLSGDYPGKLVANLEKEYDFAMFMAGAVGSQKCEVAKSGWPCVDEMASELSEAVLSNSSFVKMEGSTVAMVSVPLSLPDPQVKITRRLKVRSWLFRFAFKEYPARITGFRVGDIVLLGAPCDFSSEFTFPLDTLAASRKTRLLVTSFNGGYVGYVTPAKYFEIDHYETQLMNWYPPGSGEYMSACMKDILVKLTETPAD